MIKAKCCILKCCMVDTTIKHRSSLLANYMELLNQSRSRWCIEIRIHLRGIIYIKRRRSRIQVARPFKALLQLGAW